MKNKQIKGLLIKWCGEYLGIQKGDLVKLCKNKKKQKICLNEVLEEIHIEGHKQLNLPITIQIRK